MAPPRGNRLAWIAMGVACAVLAPAPAWPHDIPNQRVDRSIQVSVDPGRIEIAYEVSLTELTLTQDLRALIGNLPGADRGEWLERYAQVTGPLNAKGILVSINGETVLLQVRGHDLAVEEHPRYTFHFAAAIPSAGRVSISDTNYASSEGTSRLAVRGRRGVSLSGDSLPAEVEQIQVRPVWQLSDAEERRTKHVEFHYRAPGGNEIQAARGHRASPGEQTASVRPERSAAAVAVPPRSLNRISRLLGEGGRVPWLVLVAMAAGLGAVHALQPGHGKTMVTALALAQDARFFQPPLLGLATTLAHTGSVLVLAAALWYTGAVKIEAFHRGLSQSAGFLIAAAGLWRLGRQLGGYTEHEHRLSRGAAMSNLGVLALGLAGGVVPCWDAVGLLVLAAALGRLAEGVGLVLAFSVGMAVILVAVGVLAYKLKTSAARVDPAPRWQQALGLASGTLLASIGLFLFYQ